MTAIMQRETSALQIAMQANQLLDVGAMLVKSGMLPNSIRTPEAAMAIIVKGMELGLPPMAALAGITVIQGKPTVSPQLMLSLINRSGQLDNIEIETGPQGATVTMKRRGRSAFTSRFGPAEAEAMQLSTKDNYKKQAPIMYQWRAVAGCARVVFPDVIDGLYTPEEMGADVQVDEDGAMTVNVQQENKPDRSQDVTREVAQAAGVQPQQATPTRSEALIAWEEKIGKVGARLTELGLRDQAVMVMRQHPHWKTDVADASAVYTAMKQIGERHAEDVASRAAQEDNLPNQAALPLDIDEPVQAEAMISPERLKALQTAYSTKLKLSTAEDRHAFAEYFLELPEPLTSTKNLTEAQATTLMDAIGSWSDDQLEQARFEFRVHMDEKAPF